MRMSDTSILLRMSVIKDMSDAQALATPLSVTLFPAAQVLSPSELATYDSSNKRLLICVHGDLFDVSDRPDKYGPDGPYSTMAGHDLDMSWGPALRECCCG